jgi:hypothetical protein
VVDAWPSELPQCFIVGFNEGEGDGLIEYKPDTGPSISRIRSSAAVRPLSGQMRLTRAQIAILRNFYKVTLMRGALPFEFPDPTVIGEVLLVRFPKGSQPAWQQVAGGIFRASLNFEVLP